MKTSDATTTIYFDIETFAGPDKPELVMPALDSRLKDPEKIKDDKTKKHRQALENQDAEWRKQSFNPIKGVVLCIGVAVEDEDPWCIGGDTEEEIMNNFESFLQDYTYPTFVGHNAIEFDGWWMFLKGLKYKLPTVIHYFSDKHRIHDTQVMMYGPAWKKPISLENTAMLMGYQAKTDMDGSKVHDAYLRGEIEEIRRYCRQDVEITRKCYLMLDEFGIRP
jgi:hypothetical protein